MAQPRRRSLYDVLGVEPEATAADLRKAYRKLAMEHHPDRGGDELRFKEVADAYGVLCDAEKRAAYDHPPAPNIFDPNFNFNTAAGGFDWESLFPARNAAPRKSTNKEPTMFPLPIDLANFYHGLTKRLKITRDVLCRECFGGCRARCAVCEDKSPVYLCLCDENAFRRPCRQCHGSGVRLVTRQLGAGMVQQVNQRCPCGDNGFCEACQGKGVEVEAQIVTVTVLPGMRPGQRILLDSYSALLDNLQRLGTTVLAALRGSCLLPAPLTLLITSYLTPSQPTPQAPCQDIVILLTAKEDDAEQNMPMAPLRRSGKFGIDLMHEITIPLADALCGTTLQVPHFRGAYHGPLPPASPRSSAMEGPPIPDLDSKFPPTSFSASSLSTSPPSPSSSSSSPPSPSSSSSSPASPSSTSAAASSSSGGSETTLSPPPAASPAASPASSPAKPVLATIPIVIPPLSSWNDNFVVPGLGMPVWYSQQTTPSKSKVDRAREQNPGDDGAGWACPSCTFLNRDNRAPQCEMCETPNPYAGRARPPPPPPRTEQKQKPPPPPSDKKSNVVEKKRRGYGDLYIAVNVQFPPRDMLNKLSLGQKAQLRRVFASLTGDIAPQDVRELSDDTAPPAITVEPADEMDICKAEPLSLFQFQYSPLQLNFPPEISKEEMVAEAYDEAARDRDIRDSVNERSNHKSEPNWQDYHVEETWRLWVQKAREPVVRPDEEPGDPQQQCRAQ